MIKLAIEKYDYNNTVDHPQYRRSRDWRKMAVLENGGKGSHYIYITKRKHIRDLKISSGIGGRRYS